VYTALKCGYRHIDCAAVYGNEKEVGDGMKKAFAEGICTRAEVFITSKLWNSFQAPSMVQKGLQQTLTDLQTEYLDLYLIHWPTNFKAGENKFPKDANGNMMYGETSENFESTWPLLEAAVESGQCKAIGVSNFNSKQIDRVYNVSKKHTPAVLQVEVHPYCTQEALKKYCDDKKIVMTAYSPLGSPDRPWAGADDPALLQDPKLADIAAKYKKSPAQILIRFAVDRGIVVIPKSVTPSRIMQNYDVANFTLAAEDMTKIMAFNRNWHSCVPRITVDGKLVPRDAKHPEFPFGVDDKFIM